MGIHLDDLSPMAKLVYFEWVPGENDTMTFVEVTEYDTGRVVRKDVFVNVSKKEYFKMLLQGEWR